MEWYFDKKNLKWLFCITTVVLVMFFFVSYALPDKFKWIREVIGFIGGIASLAGIYIAVLQTINTKEEVDNVQRTAEAAKKAAEETKEAVRKTVSIEMVAKYCEQVKWIQECLGNGELKLVIHLTQEMQADVIELKDYVKFLKLKVDEEEIEQHIQQMGLNIGHIRKAVVSKSDKYKKDGILKNFDDLLKTLLELKSQLKQ